MANPIVPKRSSVANKVPLTTDLLVGELATNVRDGKLYMKATDGTTDTIVQIGSPDATTLNGYKWNEGMAGVNGGGSPGWVRLGTFTVTGAGGRITLLVTGADGYNNNVTTDRGGTTFISATILNNSSSTNANIAGTYCYMDRATFGAVKFTQNSTNRFSYHVDVLNTTFNDGYAVKAVTTSGGTWTRVGTTTTDPGADSSTVRAAVALGKVITSSQTGSGNGLDADTVDGIQGSALAPIASPTFTGSPKAPTPTAGDSSTNIATTAFVGGASVASAATLTTARTINGVSFNGSANITITAASPSTLTIGSYLTGANYNGSSATTWSVDATSANTASKVVARDASGNFAAGQITATNVLIGANAVWHAGNFSPSSYAPLASPALTGTPTAPTAAVGTNTTQVATTAFVKAEPITVFGGYTNTSVTQGGTSFPGYFSVTDDTGTARYVPVVTVSGGGTTPQDPVWPPADLPTTANHIYVNATTGNDTSGTGASGAPYKTIQKAATVATSNTTVHIAPGDYPESIQQLTDATSGAPIIFLSDTMYGANIIPPTTSNTRTIAFEARGDYVYLVGLDIDGSRYNAAATRWRYGINISGIGCRALFNRVVNINTASNTNSAVALWADGFYDGTNMVIEGNFVGSVGVQDTRQTYQTGIRCSCANGTVTNNVVYNCTGAAVELWNNNRNTLVSNNTCVYSMVGVYVGGTDFTGSWTGPNGGNTVQNNLIYECNYGLSETGTTGTNNVYRYNLINSSVTAATQLQNSLVASNTITSAPAFRGYDRYGAGNYRLDTGSGAIDAGTSVSAPTRDFDRSSRPRNGSVDIGAFEYYTPFGTTVNLNVFDGAGDTAAGVSTTTYPFVVTGANGSAVSVSGSALNVSVTSGSYATAAQWIASLPNGTQYEVEATLQCGNTGGYTEMGLQIFDTHPTAGYIKMAQLSHTSTTAATYRCGFTATGNNTGFLIIVSNPNVVYKVLDFRLTRMYSDVA